MIDLNKLIELAEKATQGEWKAIVGAEKLYMGESMLRNACGPFTDLHQAENDAKYMTVANPQTIKKLCEVIRVYEEALVNIKASADLGENTKDYFYNCTTINALAKGKSILDGE